MPNGSGRAARRLARQTRRLHAPKSGLGVKIAAVVGAGVVAGGTFVAVKAFTGENASNTEPLARASASRSGGGASAAPGSTTAPATTPVDMIGVQPASVKFGQNAGGVNFTFQATSCDGPSGAWAGTETISGPVQGNLDFAWDFKGGGTAPLSVNGRMSFSNGGSIVWSGNHFSGSAGGASINGTLNVTAKLVGTDAKPAITFKSGVNATVSFLGITRSSSGAGGAVSLPVKLGAAPGC
jgi:hypothetical protein